MARLYYGEVTKVIGGLKRMQPKTDAVREEFASSLAIWKTTAIVSTMPITAGAAMLSAALA